MGRRQHVCPHLGRSADIHYYIFSIVSLSIRLPFPFINSTICSIIYLLSPAVNHPLPVLSPSLHAWEKYPRVPTSAQAPPGP